MWNIANLQHLIIMWLFILLYEIHNFQSLKFQREGFNSESGYNRLKPKETALIYKVNFDNVPVNVCYKNEWQ